MKRSAMHASDLARALQRYVETRSAALHKARLELRVSELDARALLYIAQSPGTRPGRLREYLGITSAGVTTLVDRLAERGAVRRDVDPEDRRVSRLSVTIDMQADPWSALTEFDDAVSAAAAEGDPAHAKQLAEMLDSLTASASAAVS